MSIKLQLQVNIPQFSFQLTHQHRILLLGSCFSENISQLMLQNGFFVQSNPWGILYNPVSIALFLKSVIHPELDLPILPIFREDKWFSLHQHSNISSNTEEELKSEIFSITKKAIATYHQTDIITITFGTAYVYEYLEKNKQVVGNCQKLSMSKFNKRLLEVEEVVNIWSEILKTIENKKIIFTISPVRHSRDGLIENNRSKATLILAVQKLIDLFPEKCFYFPSYEIVMDELRDYRFFKDDLVHPSELAIQYVWRKWQSVFYTEETIKISNQFFKLFQFAQHKPSEGTELKHWDVFDKMKEECYKQYPDLNFPFLRI
ncbi:MAG: GSCFA domain-containing protein [Chitinophagales bacterium]|nr:GSCFA domain-containing protein [Chitinophagales bacterium]